MSFPPLKFLKKMPHICASWLNKLLKSSQPTCTFIQASTFIRNCRLSMCMHLLIYWLPSIIIRQRLSSSALLEQTGWVIGKTREKRPSSLDRSSPNKMPLSDLLLLPSYSPPESNNLQRVWAYIIKGAISPISSEIPRFGEKKLHST